MKIRDYIKCNYPFPATSLIRYRWDRGDWIVYPPIVGKQANYLFDLAGEPFYRSEGGKEWFDIPEPYYHWEFIYVLFGKKYRRFIIWRSEVDCNNVYIFGFRHNNTNHGCFTAKVDLCEYVLAVMQRDHK